MKRPEPLEMSPATRRRRRWVVTLIAAVGVAAIVTIIAFLVPSGPSGGRTGPVTAQALRAGMCVDTYEPARAEYTVVDCGVSHLAELVYRPELVPGLVSAGARYPGALAAASYVEVACRQATIGGLHFDRDHYPGDLEQAYQFEMPTELAWARGDTSGWCWIVADPGRPYERGYAIVSD